MRAAADGQENAVSSDEVISTPLIRASAEGDNDEVIRLLTAGADVDEKSSKGGRVGNLQRTALTTAAGAGHSNVVVTLLDAGAPVDRRVRGDATALIEATRNDHLDSPFQIIQFSITQTIG